MTGEHRLTASRRLPYPPDVVFAVVTDPQSHVDIDGSGMLVTLTAGRPVTAVGDTFEIDMYRDVTGAYTVVNTISVYEPDSVLEWMPAAPGRNPIRHVYGYTLRAAGDAATDVASYYDWSAISQKWQDLGVFPVVQAQDLAASLAKLEQVCAARAGDADG